MLCSKGIVLNEGKLLFNGTADEAADEYLKMIRNPQSSVPVEMRRRDSNLTLEARIHRVTVVVPKDLLLDVDEQSRVLQQELERHLRERVLIDLDVRVAVEWS